ncbi:glycosyltransferase family 2 protein, partial [Candidatus Binatia bacterium]|nr:glycosyltransferase family 2 protein [Candidatus Binatia bacterium]
MPVSVAVTIVAYDSAAFLARCLDAVASQTHAPREVIVLDNASRDASLAIARTHGAVTKVIESRDNTGFAGGQNRAIAATTADWVLTLNPDVVLDPAFLARLAPRAAHAAPPGAAPGPPAALGTLCGKLLRLDPDGEPVVPPRIDSTGIVFTRSFRHLDRGSEEPDDGRYAVEEPVFGATAAAALYRRSMIDDVSVEGEFFDEAFFAYREDADVAWRAQLLGWDCLYVPSALGYHVRRVLPERRTDVPAMLNRHSVKNRFLMRVKNADAAVWRRCALRGIARDAAVVGGCLAREWSSLPAFVDVVRLLPRARRQRALIQAKRRRDGAAIA